MSKDLGEQSLQALSGVPLNGGTDKFLRARKFRLHCCLLLWGTQIPQDEALIMAILGGGGIAGTGRRRLLWGQSEYFMSNFLSGARTLSGEPVSQVTQIKEWGWASSCECEDEG